MHMNEKGKSDKKSGSPCHNRRDEQEVLPSRFSKDAVTGGDTYNRNKNNYAKDAKPPVYGPFGFTISL